jgi:transcriptional regulator with XRE-family HTH domain
MSMREAFAANLSRLCEREASIAAVCRATSINRQQFNRYLSGDSIPNRRNLDKICRYFKIDEPDLFRNGLDRPARETPAPPGEAWSSADLRAVLKLLHSEAPTSVQPGLYFAHFAHPHDPKSLMRSAMVVRRDGNMTTFRRLTGVAEPRGSWWSHFNGDHKGLILERRHWLYFVGLNSVGNHEPNLLVLRWVPNSDPILGGHATILTPSGPTVTAAVVTPCRPKTTLRAAVKGSHAYSFDNSAIDDIVLDALDQQIQALITMVKRLNLDVTPIR